MTEVYRSLLFPEPASAPSAVVVESAALPVAGGADGGAGLDVQTGKSAFAAPGDPTYEGRA